MANKVTLSRMHSYVGPRQVAAKADGIAMDAKDVVNVDQLRRIGINFNGQLAAMAQANGFAMDNNDVGPAPSPLSGLSSPSIAVPVQFLQAWLPGYVRMITAAHFMREREYDQNRAPPVEPPPA